MSPEEKADLLGERLCVAVPEVAGFLLSELQERFQINLPNSDVEQFVIETFVLHLHLLDRMAFGALGVEGRNRFDDRIITNVASRLTISSPLDRLGNTYNSRQAQYAGFRELIPPKDQSPKGTLLWEFSKLLFFLTKDSNPEALAFILAAVVESTITLVDETLRAGETLNA